MKRWQDFGEVPDSDEENWDLATESLNGHRTFVDKKARTNIAGGQATNTTSEGFDTTPVEEVDADDLALFATLQPSKTYGKQAEPRQPREHGTVQVVPQSLYGQGRAHDTSAIEGSESTRTTDVDLQSSQIPVSHVEGPQPLNGGSDHGSSPRVSPDVQPSGGYADTGEVTHITSLELETGNGIKEDALSLGDVQSLASSPLSEREVTPPPPYLFPELHGRSPSPLAGPAPSAAAAESHQDAQGNAGGGLPSLQDLLDTTREDSRARRSFRARKEQQLHPYMYEKLAYQRQWKERGLRPIQVAEAARAAEDAQDASVSEGESQSVSHDQSSQVRNSSQAEHRIDRVGATATSQYSDTVSGDELPDVDAALRRRTPGVSHVAHKRRRLNEPAVPTPRRMVAVVPGGRTQTTAVDEYAIPPSPPPTSSTSPVPTEGARSRPRFRLPLGMSPVSLPTPQVYATRHPAPSYTSEDEGPVPASTRKTTVNLPREISSDSKAGSDSDRAVSEAEDVRLTREKRRIRGVLPASWLRIDAKGQNGWASGSLSRARRTSASPQPTQKGVAQKVQRERMGSRTPSRALAISDDDSEDDFEPGSLPPRPPALEQSRLYSANNQLTIDRATVADDEDMEVDWVDPMLPSASRASRKGPAKKSTKRLQPRIKNGFRRVRSGHPDISEGRSRRRPGPSGPTRSKDTLKIKGATKPSKLSAPKLSILDAPGSLNQSGKSPNFVRLARRAARNRPEHGRHSPSHKLLRLATDDDTRDAMQTLRAWREHTIAPSYQPPVARSGPSGADYAGKSDSLPPNDSMRENASSHDVFENSEDRLPHPARCEGHQHNRIRARATRPSRQAPTYRQSLLEPMLLDQDEPGHKRVNDSPASASGIPKHRSRKQPRTARKLFRGAQLETLEQEFDLQHRETALERRIHSFTEGVARRNRMRAAPDFQINRFISDESTGKRDGGSATRDEEAQARQQPSTNGRTMVVLHRPRKRQARRIDIDTREYRQPSEPLPIDELADNVTVEQNPRISGQQLLGLRSFGTRYPTDFDVRPLPVGTYFHSTTFIGSGGLADALAMNDLNLDSPRGRIAIELESKTLRWSTWDEEVSSDFSLIFQSFVSAADIICEAEEDTAVRLQREAGISQTIEYLLRSIVRYFAKFLSFLDPIDRSSCAARIRQFVEDVEELLDARNGLPSGFKGLCLIYSCVLSYQAVCICGHEAIPQAALQQSRGLLQHVGSQLALFIFPAAFAELRKLYDDLKRQHMREAGVQGSTTTIHAVAVLLHVLESDGQVPSFWTIVNESSAATSTALQSAPALDNAWYQLFGILPMLELDMYGTLQVGSRFVRSLDNWSAVKRLMGRVLELYPATAVQQGSTINDYVRATFVRCHCLITRWGWWRCESVLGLVFDFFAKRGMAPLQHEESRGSPAFLSELDKGPSLDIQPEDRSFGIFLKALAAGLQGMSKHSVYNARKTGGLAWRFIPNHGRTYRKDADLRQTDLDSLRNHYDLLCTLYYASPASNRVRLDLLRNLVDHTTSHREACRLSVRAWSNLAAFQVSTDESAAALGGFESWYQDMFTATLAQYRLARPEAVQQFAMAKAHGADGMTEDLLNTTVASNQRQIVATLVDLIAAMKRSIVAAKALPAVYSLVQVSKFWSVFELFEPGNHKISGMLKEGLSLLRTCLEKEAACKMQGTGPNASASEDSQDWGDSSALQEFAAAEDLTLGGQLSMFEVLQEPIVQLLSSAFGAETSPEDTFLVDLVDTWVLVSTRAVAAGTRSWASCVDQYATTSWFQLLDTTQRHKYTGYYLARLVESGCCESDEARQTIMRAWLVSLVEREGALKFQHRLTAALLNQCGGELLLQNLPFSKARQSNAYEITMQDFRQRRLSIVSSVLSNIQTDFIDASDLGFQSALSSKRTYTEVLRQLMAAMKHNYQELQADGDSDTAQADLQGSYVDFVQRVVAMLQQYISDVCQVDPFFTDSTAFPLPATDPEYVVGRLRSYAPKLREPRAQKQLVTFVYSVTERAVVDGQQPYLITQLSTALSDDPELDGRSAPTLRHVLLTSVFPVYAAGSLASTCAWILASPILEASEHIASNLLYCVKYEDQSSVEAASEIFDCLIPGLSEPVELSLTHPGLLRLAHVRQTLAIVYRVATACLTPVHHLSKTGRAALTPAARLERLAFLARAVDQTLNDSGELVMLDHETVFPAPCDPWPEARAFAARQAHEAFSRNWKAEGGRFFVKRSQGWKEVLVDLREEDEEEEVLAASLASFVEAYGRVFGKSSRSVGAATGGGGHGTAVLVV